MEKIFKKEPFEGYSFRAEVEFTRKSDYDKTIINIYSNTGFKLDFLNFIKEKINKEFAIGFEILSIHSKEEDDLHTEFINDVLNSL